MNIRDYIESALWSAINYSEDGDSDSSFDEDGFGYNDCSRNFISQSENDCESFYDQCEDAGIELHRDWQQDFWLTRNGHGAGFWDGDYEREIGQQLTKMAKAYGGVDLFLNKDGEVDCN